MVIVELPPALGIISMPRADPSAHLSEREEADEDASDLAVMSVIHGAKRAWAPMATTMLSSDSNDETSEPADKASWPTSLACSSLRVAR